MKKTYKKREEKLTSEGTELRQPVAELEAPATDHMQTGQLLRKTEVDKLDVLNSISELVAYQDTEHRVLWTNKAAAESVGLTPAQLVGRYCYEIWPQRSQPCEGCPVAKARQTGKPQKAEITTPDGRTWSIRGYPVLDANDCVVGAVEVTLDLTERKQAEEALRESEHNLRKAQQIARFGSWVLDVKTNRVEFSDEMFNIFGITKEQFAGTPEHTNNLVIPEDRARVQECYEDLLIRHKPTSTEYSIIRPDGSVRHLWGNGEVELDEKGNLQRLVGTVLDITERKHAEDKLQTILKTALDGFWLTDLEGKILEVNDSYCKMTGYTREELLRKYAQDIEAINSPEGIAQRIKRVIEQGYDRFETRNKRKDGQIIDVEISVNYLDVGKGQLFIFSRDITERKQAEQALRQSEQRYRNLYELAPQAVVTVDKKGVITSCNTATLNYTGYSKDEIVGKHFTKLPFHRLIDIPKYIKIFNSLIRGKLPEPLEINYHTKDRASRWVQAHVGFLGASGSEEGFQVAFEEITERKLAEEALRESQEQLKRMFDSVTDGIVLTALDGTILKVNQRAAKMHGFASRAEMIGKSAFDLVAPRDREKIAVNMGRAIKEGIIRDVEYTLLKADGSEFPAELSTSVLKDASGNVIGHITVSRDITERKHMEEALQAEKNKLQSLIDAMEDDLSIQDKNHNIIYQNEPSKTNFGDHLGEKCYQVYEGRDKVCPGCPVKKAFKDGKSHTSERKTTTLSGEVIYLENTANLIKDAGGEIVACLEVGRNITERKQAEEALQAEKNKLQSLIDAMEYNLTIQDKDYNIIYQNEPSMISSGGSRIGEKCYRVYGGKENVDEDCPVKKAFKDGKSHTVERQRLSPSGEVIFWENTANPIRDASGKIVSCLEVGRNITERKQAAEREKEMQRELLLSSRLASIGELAAGVAHQINNPLTGVLGFSQRLLKKSTDQETKQDLKRIYTEAERAAKVVQNLLTFARRRQPHKQHSDINEILESALELRAYELKTSNIEVVTDLTPKLPELMLDFYQIQEVFLNIILNAEQAMTKAHNGGKLTIMTVERRGYVRTTFTDDGPGIPADNLDNIFDPFFTTKGEKGGTGLGLSVCHGIITEHGGKIYAKSKLGKGTTFFVELPLPAH